MAEKLTDKQAKFVEEYLLDLNATQAAIRAGYSAKTADRIGPELLGKTCVADAIRVAQAARSKRTEITADMVLKRWWEIATANPNELVEYRRNNCRHCYGENHLYQWTEAEYLAAQNLAASKDQASPEADGGFGFDALREANPDCPECRGEGDGTMHVHDTRKVKGSARLLYAGVKQTKQGLEVVMHDQAKALENVARHLGMFVEKVEASGPGGGAIPVLNLRIGKK